MKNSLLISFFILSHFCFSQTKIDSLISSIDNASSTPEKVKNIHAICWKLMYSYSDSCLQYCNQALKISHEINNDSLVGKSFNLKGIVYDIKSKWDTSLIYYDSAYLYAVKAKDSGLMAGVHNNNGLIYWNTGELRKAINEYILAEKIFIKIGKQKGLANCYNNIALIQVELRNGEKALEYNYKSLEIRKEIEDKAGVNYSKLNIAGILLFPEYNIEYKEDPYPLAFEYLMENEKFFDSVQNYYALGKVYMHTASYYDRVEKYDSAIFFIEKAIGCYEKIGAKNLVASTTYNSNFYYLNDGQFEKAKEQVEKAHSLAKETGSNSLMYKIKNELAEIYLERGRYKESAKLFMDSRRLQDSIYNIEKQKDITIIEEKYESEKKQNEINSQKAQLLESDITSLKKQRLINILIGSIAFLSLAGFFFFIRRKRILETEKDKAIQVEREKGLKSVIESQELERERIAKNLHDGVIQQLVSLKFGMDALIDDHKLNLVKQLDDATYELRDLSHDLMPKNLEKFGLNEAVSNLLETSFSNSKITYSYDCIGLNETLPKEIEINIYRSVQELIHNTIKHSNASNVDVQLYQMDNVLHVIFEDDGVGFDSKEHSNGIGIQSIKSRIKSLKGTINFENSPNSGCLATIKIPIIN